MSLCVTLCLLCVVVWVTLCLCVFASECTASRPVTSDASFAMRRSHDDPDKPNEGDFSGDEEFTAAKKKYTKRWKKIRRLAVEDTWPIVLALCCYWVTETYDDIEPESIECPRDEAEDADDETGTVWRTNELPNPYHMPSVEKCAEFLTKHSFDVYVVASFMQLVLANTGEVVHNESSASSGPQSQYYFYSLVEALTSERMMITFGAPMPGTPESAQQAHEHAEEQVNSLLKANSKKIPVGGGGAGEAGENGWHKFRLFKDASEASLNGTEADLDDDDDAVRVPPECLAADKRAEAAAANKKGKKRKRT